MLRDAEPLVDDWSSPDLRASVRGVGRAVLAFWSHRGWLLFAVDFATVIGTFLLAYHVRFQIGLALVSANASAPPDRYLQGAGLLAIILTFLVWRDGGYTGGFRGMSAPTIRVRILAFDVSFAIAILMAVSFLWRDLLLSRQVFLTTGVLTFVTMFLTRQLFRAIDQDLAQVGYVSQRVAIVGNDPNTARFASKLRSSAGSSQLVGWLRWPGQSDADLPKPVLGSFSDIQELASRTPVNVLVLGPEIDDERQDDNRELIADVLNTCEANGIALYTVPRSLDIAVTASEVGTFSGLALIRLQDAALHPVYAIVKRAIDVVASALLLLFGLPIWILIAALIKRSGPGPVLFEQRRAGVHGREFNMYKFRSMVVDAEARLGELVDVEALEQPVFKIRNDPRVTPIGRLLRRTSLDEIPQLLNVLLGDMSLVGPRPEELKVVARYTPWQRRRLKAKPGITGLQQVTNRGEPDLAERIRHDLVYLKHQGPLLDLFVLWRTIGVVVRGSGVTH